MIDSEEKVTVIDFPQLVHVAHLNAKEYFDRDVQCIRDFFSKRLNIEVNEFPSWEEAVGLCGGDAGSSAEPGTSLLNTGVIEGLGSHENDMLVEAHDQIRQNPGADSEDDGEGEQPCQGEKLQRLI